MLGTINPRYEEGEIMVSAVKQIERPRKDAQPTIEAYH
jgi:hypothetical protein